MSTVAPVALPLLEGIRCRPGASEAAVKDALTRFEAARCIARWCAVRWKQRCTYVKERSNKRRKIKSLKKKGSKKASSSLVVSHGSSKSSWEPFIFQALQSPSLPVRQVSLRVLLKGSPARWQLRDALVSLVNSHVIQEEPSPESAIQLVGLLSHLVSEDQPWRDPVLHETDNELKSFIAGGGLRWVTHSILKLAQSLSPLLDKTKDAHLQSNMLAQKSEMALEALQLKLCLMVHLCYRLVLYSAVPSPPKEKPSNKERNPTLLSAESPEALSVSAKMKRRRALSESSKTSEKSASPEEDKKFKDLAADRLVTLQQLHEHFWSTTLTVAEDTCLSPLACLLCVYEMLRDKDTLAARTKRASQCLAILARLVNPSATATVVSYEEASFKNKKNKTDSAVVGAVSAEARSASAAVAMAQAALNAAVEEDDDEEEVDDIFRDEDDDDDDDEIMEDVEELDQNENGNDAANDGGDQDEEDAVEEQDSDDIVEDEDVESEDEGEGEDEEGDEFVVPDEHDDDIVDVVRQFEQRIIDMNGTDLLQADGEEGLALDRGRSQTASNIPPATEKDRSQTLIRACMQILAAQHPPTATGMLHGSIARSGQPKRRNQSASHRPLLSPSAEQSLIKRVCNVVKPPRKPLNLKMFMRRAPTQEEFFRGSLTQNPVPISSLVQPGASSTEPTVRDLRQHVADDLQMSDSAELIELLVANQILDLSLNLRVVQQVLWKRYLIDNSSSSSSTARQPGSSFFGSGLSVIFSSGSGQAIAGNVTEDTPVSALPPMVVTYRLAGVDGEATEEIVSTLEDPEASSSSASAEERERLMEKEYGVTRLVTEGRGISILLRSIESDIFDTLRRIRRDDVARLRRSDGGGSNPSRAKFQQSAPCSGLVLLRHCTQLASNRKKLLEAQAPTFLLRLLLDVLNSLDENSARAAAGVSQGSSESDPADEAHALTNPTADMLQELIETLASDMSPELETALTSSADHLNEASCDDMEEDAEEAASTLPLLLSSLRTIYLGPPMRKVIAKLLPFLTYNKASLSRELAANFVTHVNIEALGELEVGDKPASRASVLMDTFVQAAISIPPSGVCNSLRAELINCGFVDQVVSFVLKDIPQSPPPWSPALWSKGDDFGGMKRDAIEKMWRSYFLRNGLQTGFKMLAGLCNGHEQTQSRIAGIGARKSPKGDVSFLTACHWLESTSDNSSLSIDTKDMGLLAETLLDELSSGNERVSKKVKACRKETRGRKKEIAQETRSKTLSSMNSFGPMAGDTSVDQNQASVASADTRSQSAVGIVGSVARRAASLLSGGPATRSAKSPKKSDKSKPSWLEEMEAMEDETGLTCAVCQEGRSLQPAELLGLYTYVKKVTIPLVLGGGRTQIDGSVLLVSLPRSLPPSLVNTTADHEWFRPARIAADSIKESTDIMAVMASGSTANRRSTNLITTVSAGNAIHCSCHSKARSADRNHPRAPKSEWEGASLRNSRVECNAILPLVSSKSSKVSLMAVDMALSEHQSVVSNILGQKPRSNLWLVLHDVRLLLLRMAYGEALNADCGGGSLSSNVALLHYQLAMADMFARDAEHDSPYTAQHARYLSAGFLAATNLLRANDFDASGSTGGVSLTRGIADSAPMASLCCILLNNNSDEEGVEPVKGVAPHSRRRWALQKEEFLRGLIVCAGRRHALGIEDSGCVTATRGSRANRVRSRSFTEWDAEEGASSRRKPSTILGKRGLPQIDDFAKALRPMITLYALFDQLSSDFVIGMDDEAVEASTSRLVEVAEACQQSSNIHELLQKANVSLDQEEIILYLQKGISA